MYGLFNIFTFLYLDSEFLLINIMWWVIEKILVEEYFIFKNVNGFFRRFKLGSLIV